MYITDKFVCEYCGERFDSITECKEHEACCTHNKCTQCRYGYLTENLTILCVLAEQDRGCRFKRKGKNE